VFLAEAFFSLLLAPFFSGTSDSARCTGGGISPARIFRAGRRRGGRKGYECHPQALIDAIQRPLDATMDGGCTPMSFPVAIVEGAQLEET